MCVPLSSAWCDSSRHLLLVSTCLPCRMRASSIVVHTALRAHHMRVPPWGGHGDYRSVPLSSVWCDSSRHLLLLSTYLPCRMRVSSIAVDAALRAYHPRVPPWGGHGDYRSVSLSSALCDSRRHLLLLLPYLPCRMRAFSIVVDAALRARHPRVPPWGGHRDSCACRCRVLLNSLAFLFLVNALCSIKARRAYRQCPRSLLRLRF